MLEATTFKPLTQLSSCIISPPYCHAAGAGSHAVVDVAVGVGGHVRHDVIVSAGGYVVVNVVVGTGDHTRRNVAHVTIVTGGRTRHNVITDVIVGAGGNAGRSVTIDIAVFVVVGDPHGCNVFIDNTVGVGVHDVVDVVICVRVL